MPPEKGALLFYNVLVMIMKTIVNAVSLLLLIVHFSGSTTPPKKGVMTELMKLQFKKLQQGYSNKDTPKDIGRRL